MPKKTNKLLLIIKFMKENSRYLEKKLEKYEKTYIIYLLNIYSILYSEENKI